ncbi:hypothetical protein ACWDRB_47165 [Nonomuraea sp. NPDC003707]
MTNPITSSADLREITIGTLLDIPSRAMPPALLDPPAPAVVIEQHLGRSGNVYVAAVALEWTPFLTLRWHADAWAFTDVAAWRDLWDARIAAASLQDLLDQQARGGVVQPRVYCRIQGADTSRWRVIGPHWGGTVEETDRPGRVRVYTDHDPDPVAVSASLRAGARKLVRLHGMPNAILV